MKFLFRYSRQVQEKFLPATTDWEILWISFYLTTHEWFTLWQKRSPEPNNLWMEGQTWMVFLIHSPTFLPFTFLFNIFHFLKVVTFSLTKAFFFH